MYTNPTNRSVCRPLPFLVLTIVFAALTVALQAPAQQAPKLNPDASTSTVVIKRGHVKYVPINAGKQMYAQYCASCHGVSARGDGPAAPALKYQPTDLTLLSAQNGGKFPRAHVRTVLTDHEHLPAHGSTDMPIWGSVFRTLDQGDPSFAKLRVHNLSRYLESLQVPNPNAVALQAYASDRASN